MTSVHRTMTVPAAQVETYRAMAEMLGSPGEFITPCYTGQTLSHYISAGHVSQTTTDILGDVPRFAELAGITVAQAQALRDGMDVSTESWQDHCNRIGVTLEAE